MDTASPPPRQIRATGHTDAVLAVAAAVLDGRETVVTASADGTLRRWDAATGAPLGAPLTGHTGPVHAVALGTPSGRPAALSGGYDALRRWDLATGEQLGEALVDPDPAAATITRATRAQDGGLLAVTSPGHDAARPMRVWDAATGTPIGRFPYGTGKLGLVDRTVAVALARVDGRTVVVSSTDDAKVRIWDATTGRQLGKPLVERYSVRSLTTADLDGRPLALLGSDHRSARLLDLATREPLGEPLTGHSSLLYPFACCCKAVLYRSRCW
ncbi:WD40 repeat domain-containing protein [Kitasatospora sp. NPDC088134]|uniref:WD40 repeat domain-containing protein n=1 Tax=Kitasatospora sp. NPDC088134 TaxID=3364071 RepID=UPI0037F839F7